MVTTVPSGGTIHSYAVRISSIRAESPNPGLGVQTLRLRYRQQPLRNGPCSAASVCAHSSCDLPSWPCDSVERRLADGAHAEVRTRHRRRSRQDSAAASRRSRNRPIWRVGQEQPDGIQPTGGRARGTRPGIRDRHPVARAISHLITWRHVRAGVIATQALPIVDVVRLVEPGRVLDLVPCAVDVHLLLG
jgi:hypothetical protein